MKNNSIGYQYAEGYNVPFEIRACIAAKKKYDQATANLKQLLDKRDAIRKEEIMSAIVKDGPMRR